jgi:hypothetical protein
VADEVVVAMSLIYSKLKARPALGDLGCYPDVAPPDAVAPYIVYSMQSGGSDLIALGAKRIWSDMLFQVQAVDQQSDYTSVATLALEIDTALHGQVYQSAGGGTVYECIREAPIQYTEIDGHVTWKHKGGLYRLRAAG